MKPILNLEARQLPFLKVLLLYVLGILFGEILFWNDQTWYAVMAITGIVFVLGFILYFMKMKLLFTIIFYLFVFLLGVVQLGTENPKTNKYDIAYQQAQQYIGIVVDEPVVKQKSIRFPLQLHKGIDSVSSFTVSGRVMVTLLRDSNLMYMPVYGDEILVKNAVKEVSPAYNPNEFNYKRYLSLKSIEHQLFLKEGEFVLIGKADVNKFMSWILNMRQYLVDKYRTYIEDELSFQIASALVFGYRSEMDQSTLSAFTNTGTIHVLSVSGLHVTLVFAFLTYLLKPVDRLRYGRNLRFSIAIFVIWLYVVLTGMAPPILRSGIMITFFILASWMQKQQPSLNTLLGSAFFILLFSPNMFYDIGFQLSYMAMLGIFLIYPLMKTWYMPKSKILRWIVEYSYVSVSAQLLTAPLALYYFGQFPNYFLPANLLISIPSTIIMYGGLVLMLSPVHLLNVFLGKLEEILIQGMFKGLHFIDHLPLATFQGISFSIWQVLLFLLIIAGIFWSFNYKSKFVFFFTSCLSVMLILTCYYQYFSLQNYQGIKFYNVRNQIAFAEIKKGNVTLFSTLDSLTHPTLSYAVLPDLKYYTRIEHIGFVHLPSGENVAINVSDERIVLLRNSYGSAIAGDFIIFRNNISVKNMQKMNAGIAIIDGSNAWYHTNKQHDWLKKKNIDTYVLKDNFAYVWQKK